MSEMNQSSTFAWEYFDRGIDDDRDEAKCQKCGTLIKCKGGSTSGMLRHLKNKHSIQKRAPSQHPSTSASKRSKSSHAEPTLEETVAKLVAVDNFPPSALSKSEFIRQALSDKGMPLPKIPIL